MSNRARFFRSSTDNSIAESLSSMATTSTTSSRPASRSHYTGFPDFFAERTTSWRHPDANTSPDACITAEDIDPSKSLHRSRRSFMAKHKRTTSYGRLTPEQLRQHAEYGSSLALSPLDSAIDVSEEKELMLERGSKDGDESADQIDGSSAGDASPISSTMSHSISRPHSSHQKAGLFRKWRH